MSISENNQNKKEPLSADYQEVHHKKNAFVVGDRVYMWKNEKGTAVKVWRTVVSFDEIEGKLGFEGSAKRVTVRDFSEVKHDNVITVEAWERAFSTCVGQMTAREIRKFREGCVVSYETVDGVLCVVLTNSRPNVHTKWYYRHDYGSLVKKEDTSQKHLSKWYIKPGAAEPVRINPNKASGEWLPLSDDWFVLTKNGQFCGWKPTKRSKIAEVCPWLKEMAAKWKSDSRPKAVICNIYELANRNKQDKNNSK